MPSVTPLSLRRLDEAGHHLAPAIAFDHPPATAETTCPYQYGSDAAGASGEGGSDVDTRPVHYQ